MKTKRVTVVPYDGSWPERFSEIRSELEECLGDLTIGIEHVGSTSVPGLSAKPIIDIDVVIEDASELPEVIDALSAIGYEFEGDLGIPDRYAFRYEYKDHLMAHHLYVCPHDSKELQRHLALREYLRAVPEAVREYSRIKEEAAERYPDDIDGYIAYKSPFIENIYSIIGLM